MSKFDGEAQGKLEKGLRSPYKNENMTMLIIASTIPTIAIIK